MVRAVQPTYKVHAAVQGMGSLVDYAVNGILRLCISRERPCIRERVCRACEAANTAADG